MLGVTPVELWVDDDLKERRAEQTREARSILLSTPSVPPADLWDDDAGLSDEKLLQEMKEEKAWRASHTYTSCGYSNRYCWCKRGNYEEMRAALKGPVKTQQKELPPWFDYSVLA